MHKANIMKFSDGLYLHVAREVAAENDDIEFDDRIVDNMCMQLVQRPEEYDVLVLPNLYGDVLSDLCAGMIGGLGLAPGANFGEGIAIFEPTHGSAPKYAGQNKVNPMAQLLSGMLMLRHLDEDDAADNLEQAIAEVIREGKSVTYDMKPTPRRSDRRRDERGRRRDHREARSARCVGRSRSIGAGMVGRTVAQEVARRDYADVVIVDIVENLPQGIALDINQAGPVLGYEAERLGLERLRGDGRLDVVVITAGVPRKPGMSRDDLVTTNEKIVGSVTEQAIAQSPDAILIVVSNPLDAMCHVAKNVSGFPKERVFGQAGILDTARFRRSSRGRRGSSVKDVQALVLGGHGDQMVSVVSATTVGGVPLAKLVARRPRSTRSSSEPRRAAARSSTLLGTSAWYAPGAATAQMVHSVMLDEKRVLPCTAYLEGEYGIDGPLHGRAGEARRRRHRGDRRARADRGRADDAAGIRRRRARGRRRPAT